MTKLEKMRESLALEYQNQGCVSGALVFENARTRWAAKDFEAGFNASTAYHSEIIQELVETLRIIYHNTDRSTFYRYDKLQDSHELMIAALESVRSKI